MKLQLRPQHRLFGSMHIVTLSWQSASFVMLLFCLWLLRHIIYVYAKFQVLHSAGVSFWQPVAGLC